MTSSTFNALLLAVSIGLAGTAAQAQTAHSGSSDAVGDGPLTHEGNGSTLGTGMTGAVPNDAGTHASGAMNGNAAINDSPVAGTGNLGSGSTSSGSDPMNGSNSLNGPAIPTGSLSNTSH